MKRVIVTGATGFIGAHLLRVLSEKNIDVLAVNRKGSKNTERISNLVGVKCIEVNYDQIDCICEMADWKEADVWFHLAWEGASGSLRSNPEIQVKNIGWTVKIAQIVSQMKVKKLIVTGTVCENQCDHILDNIYTGASAYYLLAKKEAYELLHVYCQANNIPLVWITFYHPFGKYNKPEQLIVNTIDKIRHGKEAKFGPADNLFDVIAVEDLANALYLAGNNSLMKDRYYVGSQKPRKLKEYIEQLVKIVNPKADVKIGEFQSDGLPMLAEWLDDCEFRNETGYRAEISFEEMVRNYLIDCN